MQINNHIERIYRFYGDVAAWQNRDIINLISGKKVLDIGCGYGSLLNQIKKERKDTEVKGIDTDKEAIEIAQKLYGLKVKCGSVYKIDFSDNLFETVILRETIHHFNEADNLNLALREISRVCSKELIVFDPNPNWIVKISRKIINHKDPEMPLDVTIKTLEERGFYIKSYFLRDVFAFALSGGFVGLELVPNIRPIKRLIIEIDAKLNDILIFLNMQKHFCWRYLIYATKNNKLQ